MSGQPVGAEPVIRVRDLRKHYGDVKAVDGVSFEVARGEVFGMLGPNGAGKTTTIEILEGLRPPDSGELRCSASTRAAPRPDQAADRRPAPDRCALPADLTVTELLDLFGSFSPAACPRTS